jgi:hypothetical protein
MAFLSATWPGQIRRVPARPGLRNGLGPHPCAASSPREFQLPHSQHSPRRNCPRQSAEVCLALHQLIVREE